MHIAIITAGGAGMFCGSCMHDNTWARALSSAGAEVTLIPTYTPIRVDEENVSSSEVFLGGINVYLDYRIPFWRKIPRSLTRWLDSSAILSTIGKIGVSNNAQQLGPLTLAMLEGESGPQRNAVDELADYLTHRLRPDVICFSNALLVGALHRVREQFDGQIFCTLQGDDIFLEDLPEPHRRRSIELIHQRAREFDGFLVHSRYYRDFMSEYLNLPIDKFHQIPLGIDLTGHDGQPKQKSNAPFTVGYFARICKEKGLLQLAEAFRILHSRHPNTRLKVGGYFSRQNKDYLNEVMRTAPLEFVGSPATHREKVELLKSFDVLSVPTVYREPKGLYVLEALANGVPVVQPAHGAFPELIESTGGGILVEPDNVTALANGLEQMLTDHDRRVEMAMSGRNNVHSQYDLKTMAEASLEIFANSLSPVGSR